MDEESIAHSFKRCGITNSLDGSEDELFNRKLQDAVAEHNREAECREDAALCILDDTAAGSDEEEDDFEGFSDYQSSSDEEDLTLAQIRDRDT